MPPPESGLHARVASLEQRLTAAEHDQLQLRAISRRTHRIDLNLRLLLRHLKIMSVSEHAVDTAEDHER
ncbi:hypothetical protein ACIQUM_37385 [Amycolatopsis azurea]|uniref:hypothetical protein n=1 Tax=Amycolatopsis azurea TaxID=36819 RepID=UPI00380B0B07